jgi:UDP-N-acetylglucosamine 2-epimerase (non-hydrolysing)
MIAVDLIAAARPNFMKVAPLYKALAATDWCRPRLVHTGQHYDANMSDAFFADLGKPEPAAHLGIGSGTHAATKVGIKVAHLEAGHRSRDRTMPEELNRIATDALADLLCTPSRDGDENLRREGVRAEKIEFVGNIMIDSLEMLRPVIESRRYRERLELAPKDFGVVTLHRPSNVDDSRRLKLLADVLVAAAAKLPVVFPVHPRTKRRLEETKLLARLQPARGLFLTEPLGYTDFLSLVLACRYALTDSGGIQEGTTYLGIPPTSRCATIPSARSPSPKGQTSWEN